MTSLTLWKVPGRLFKKFINRITAICNLPRHESASFNAEQDDAMAPKASHAITCMHTWEIVPWLKKLNYSFWMSMSKNHSIFCFDKSFWIFWTLSTSSQCSLMNLTDISLSWFLGHLLTCLIALRSDDRHLISSQNYLRRDFVQWRLDTLAFFSSAWNSQHLHKIVFKLLISSKVQNLRLRPQTAEK